MPILKELRARKLKSGYPDFGFENVASQTGFTLIEILVAISIIAMIAVVAIPNYHAYQKNQLVLNSSKQLASWIRLAQSNARTGTKCPDPTYTEPRDWDIILNSSTAQCGPIPNSFQFRALCYNLNSQYNLSTPWVSGSGIQQVWPDSSQPSNFYALPAGVTMTFPKQSSTGTCSSYTGDIWNTNSLEFLKDGTMVNEQWSSPSFPYTITLTDGTNTHTVTIDTSGNVTVN